MLRTLALSVATGAAALLALAPAPANAHTSKVTQAAQVQSAAVCGKSNITISGGHRVVARNARIVITGSNVAVREFPFNNGEPLRFRATGTTWTTCGFYAGDASNGYADKCGGSGRNWHAVRINTVNSLGWRVTVGYIPTTCAQVR